VVLFFGGDDFADEWGGGGWGGGDVEGFEEHGVGFVEEGWVGGEEGDEGLAGGDGVAEFGMHFDAGMGADGISGAGAAGAEALDGPADLGAVHRGEEAGVGGGEGAGGGGAVEGGGAGEGGLPFLGFPLIAMRLR
jgi:hypothetical protein